MAHFVFQDWELDVDVESTRKRYGDGFVSEDDPCARNYRAFCCGQLTKEEQAFFDELGIDPEQTGLLLTLFREKDGSLDYAGYYHAVGRLLRAPQGDGLSMDELFWEEHPHLPIRVGRFGITPVIQAEAEDTEPPMLTLRFSVVVPWLLDGGAHRMRRRKRAGSGA